MTKKAVKAEINSFVRGLITEASPLNFPENASLAEENYELLKTGIRQRRLGMDYEMGFTGRIALFPWETLETSKIKTYVWEDAGGHSGKDILAIQFNNRLHFFDLNVESISNSGFIQTITFTPEELGARIASFTSVDGRLIVASGGYDVIAITYDIGTNAFAAEGFQLKVRDLWGVEFPPSDQVPNYRPPQNAPSAHFYNLYNQSWGVPRRWEGAGVNQLTDPVAYFSSQKGVLPSNEETVWTAMSVKADADPYEYLRPNAWDELRGASPEASKGYFIIDLLRRGASRISAIETNKGLYPQMYLSTFSTNADIAGSGPTIVQEFAGRVFYGGFSGAVIAGDNKSPVLSSYLVFSKLVNNFKDLGKCYQEGDPTSREGTDIVDTDGGFVRISGMNQLLSLQNIGSALLAIANNGVWAITGGSDYGFSATNYKVSKVSDFGAVSAESIVKVGGSIMFWGQNAIFTIGANQVGDFSVTSLTDDTIQTFYANLSTDEKLNATGIYDDLSKTVRWIYYESQTLGLETGIRELILDTRIPAFYIYKINLLPNTFIKGLFQVPSFRMAEVDVPILVGTDVVLSSTQEVIIPYPLRIPTASSVRYMVLASDTENSTFFTFAYYRDGLFRDWRSQDGVGIDAKAFLITGALTAGDSSVDKQVPYVTVHMYRTENGVDIDMVPTNQSGCLMRSRWEWSNSPNSNKWGPPQQVYRYRRGYLTSDPGSTYDTGFELITTKNKLRGIGKSVSLYFESEPYKDCRIVGWNININGNAVT